MKYEIKVAKHGKPPLLTTGLTFDDSILTEGWSPIDASGERRVQLFLARLCEADKDGFTYFAADEHGNRCGRAW